MRADNHNRVSRRSSTGIRKDAGPAEKREPIRDFEEADDISREDPRRNDRRDSYRGDRRDDYRDDYRRDDRRSDRRDDRRGDYRDDRREDYRNDRREDDRRGDYRDERRDPRYDEREYDDLRYRRSRREAPKWDDYRFDDEEEDRRRDERRGDRRDDRSGAHREEGEKEKPRRRVARRTGGDTELFVHQIVPYILFWLGLFAAVSFILRDIVNRDGSVGVFGSWFADFLGGLLGPAAYLIPVFFVVLSLRWKKFVKAGTLAKKLVLSALFVLLLSAIIHVFIVPEITAPDTVGQYATGAALTTGGVLGGFVGEWMGYILRDWGTGILGIPLLLIIGIYLIGMTPSGIWQRLSYRFKLSAERRNARRKAMYDGEEERGLRVKGKNGNREKLEAAPAEPPKIEKQPDERVHYTFRGDEEEYNRNRHRAPVEASAVKQESSAAEEPVMTASAVKETERPAPEQATTRVRSSADLVDIPDDLPDELADELADEPTADARAILDSAGSGESSEDKLDQILKEMSERAAAAPAKPEPAKPEATAEEKPLQGTYYAPFALPRRPEPVREPREEAPRQAQPPKAAPTVPAEEKKTSYLTEEPLGSLHPIHREQKQTPAAQEPAAQGEEVLAYRPAQPVYSAPIRESAPVAAQPVAPAAPANETPTAPSETVVPAPAYKQEPVQTAPAQEPVGGFSFAVEEEEQAPVSPVKAEPAKGVRTSFGVAQAPVEQKPVQEPLVQEAAPAVPFVREEVTAAPARPAEPAQQPAAQRPTDPLVRPMRPKAQVLTRSEPVKEEPKPATPPPVREYRLPPMNLLKEDTARKENDHSEEMQANIEILRETLASFHVRIREDVTCSRGPTITRYELRPEAGVSVRSVINRQEDLSLNLSAPVRIEAPIPGKPAIGIEVPNQKKEIVFMRTVLESDLYKNSTKPLEVPLGLDVGGDIQMCDLSKMPHLLVAGSTGSGKSVCINTILISLMYKTSPNDLRLILIDPKQVEFTSYADVPHLYAPIVTEPARAVGVLACAVQEMERRYSLIKDVGVRNIEGYNAAIKNDPEREHLPYMVIVIDEFADLKMACTNNDVENFTCRLAQKARAAGMHLIIGTQRPTVNVITGNLKNNIPSRIAFKVTQQTDSRTILDVNGAETLIGRGDMLYMTAGLPKPARVQGAFVSDEEVESVARYIIEHNEPVQYSQSFMDQIEVEMARAESANRKDDDFGGGDDDDGDEDPKFREAVELAIETQKVATSLLQRRLGVGYGRAAKIIDRMEALGYVSAPDGNKPRKVLITHQEYAAHMMNGEEDYADDNY